MRINRTRIRNLELYLAGVPNGGEYRVAYQPADAAALARVGLGEDAGEGETLLPSIVGPVTRFNAEGKWLVRRDLPRENRYINTIRWRWTTWNGEENEEFRDVYRECYQRELLPPPGIELTYLEQDGRGLIVSPTIQHDPANAELGLHVINVFLELFKACEITAGDLEAIELPSVRKANWKLLPTGEYPWEKVSEHIEHATEKMTEASRSVIVDRQKALEALKPNERWVGEGGFSDYMAYVFSEYGLVVLESLRRDNAIYVFTGDWRPISRLTKAQIIQGGYHHARIVHTEGWKSRLRKLFVSRAA